ADITRRDIRELLDGIVARGKAPHAHHVLAYLRPALAWAVDREIITSNPAEGISDPDPRRREARTRDRYLDDDEVRLFWQACDQLDRPFGPLFKLLLLTGQRREEVAGMRWSELDLVKRVWTLPRGRVKNEKGHVVHLSSLAVKIIEALPKVRSEADLVFTTTGKTAVSGFGRAQQRLAAAMLKLRNADLIEGSDAAAAEKVEIAHFTIHDLRRTTATGMAGIGIAHHVLDKVLNHTSGKISGVGAIYNRFEYFDEREAALAAWARHVETLMGEVPSNLRQLSEARSRRARVSQ
ncbi:MAG TPA: site-specific integrase, partial [Stellaceae bacterium]|nr:site-specific integrase [Stellaceae bacterium]